MGKGNRPDYILIIVVGLLVILGLVVLASVSTAFSQGKFGNTTSYLFRYIGIGLLPGILAGFVAFKIPLAFLRKWIPLVLLGNLFLMVLVFFPKIGITAGGASRWLNLGFTSFQPSEFLKLTFILYLAAWLPFLSEKNKKNFAGSLFAFLVVLGLVALLLVLQSDVGTLCIIVACGITMYFLSGNPWKYSLAILFFCFAVLAALIKFEPYRVERIKVFLDPNFDPMGISYQIKQALIAVGSGGIWGKGLGMSLQKFGFLPHPMSDSIFAVFSEETGLIGGLILLSLFSILVWRGFKIAKEVQDKFSKLVCLGITSWIVLQAFVNMGAMVGLLPLTGIPLPFLSYGGSALVAELIGVGILLNISKNA